MYNLYNKTQADLNEEERMRDEARLAEDGAYRQGYFKGFVDGTAQGYAKGWADAMKKVDDVRREQQEAMDAVFRRNGGGY